ncbi:MAG: glycosyltransferase family 39 protein [Deltaproteobacteria bacterium]|nr:glycosyltransferase family 39 protein [Deltaproteobacteria bacterium]
MLNRIKPSPEIGVLSFIILFFYLLRLFIIGRLELAPDEAYYWYWSKHLDLSYADHPPMVAYITAFFTGIGGDTEFFVRLGGLVFSTAALVLLYQTSMTLFPDNKRMAWELLFIFNLTLLFSAGCLLQTPDSMMFFFWAAAIFWGSKVIRQGSPRYWYGWGIAIGLGLLSKYTMILIVPCTFIFLLLSSPHRFWLKKKEPYLALLIALGLFSPVIFWNWQHHWVSFLYQLEQGFNPERRDLLQVINKLWAYLGELAAVFTPLLFIAFVIYSVKGTLISLKGNKKEYLYLSSLSWPILLFFGLSTALGKVAGANWPAPAFIAGTILMVSVYHEYFKTRKGHQIFIGSGVALALILSIMAHVHLIRPFIPIAPNLDPTQQFHGWRALGAKINKYLDENPGPDRYFLVGDRGTTVAEAVFYTQNRFLGLDFNRPERYLFLSNIGSLQGREAVLILHNQNAGATRPYHPYFEAFQGIGRHHSIFRNTPINSLTFQLVLGKGFRGNWSPHSGRPN